MRYPITPIAGVARAACATAILLSMATTTTAKPIAFADGFTFMHERDRNTVETQMFYAPAYWWSIGAANGFMTSDDKLQRDEFNYVQGNLLLKRWNFSDAQANLFASAGVGTRKIAEYVVEPIGQSGGLRSTIRTTDTVSANRVSLQGDYETRRIYASFKFDAHRSDPHFDWYDTFQLGWSPYAHDYDDLAAWFVAQVKKYRGMDDKTEGGAFLRLFKGDIWVELGINERRKSQLMFMINY